MVLADSSPGGRRPASAPLWIIPPAVLAVCAALAVVAVPADARVPVAWCALVALLAVALASLEVVHRGRVIAVLRQRHAAQEDGLRRRLAEQETETLRLASDLLPAAMSRLQKGLSIEEVLRGVVWQTRLDPRFEAAHSAVLRSVIQAVQAEGDLRDSAQRAFVNIARRVQAIVHQQAQDMREMEDRHGADPAVFGDLLHLDHGTALIGRLADSIAVLGGSRPGRQWQKSIPLYNVLRGAMSRIIDYQRVELHSVAEVGVVGPGVEPLIHALAELLDNATRYSPPQTRVHLTAIEVQSGVAVEIEDAGVGLTEEARVRAERVLAQAAESGLDLNDLGESPRLGLAVVSKLSHANAFQVSLRPSAYGGVRAVLVVPQNLITATPVPGGMIARAAVLPPPKPVRRAMPMGMRNGSGVLGMAGMDEPIPGPRNDAGRPQRRRRGPGTAPRRAASPAAPRPAPQRPAESAVQPGIWLAAFQDGVSGEPSVEPSIVETGRQNYDASSDGDE
ncbi:ATP-binding protein [Streptomyces sp. H27-D2]|uniref:ATP-binding protein n=1 Tax=Streptomyces sp. H27-D2 TaxID=3046304 RepID=UPI002DBDACD2|nr:ATP-binding protein [Streptomyces sp. H27-D2]MEC4019566.1 ATP-binding protein [Streptomyces sp. H27-D2]